MERWLGSRGALIAAWGVVGALVLGAAGFALFLLLPAGSGGDTPAVLPSVTVAAVATATVPSGRALFTGTVERIEGQALVVQDQNKQPRRVLVRTNAHVGRLSSSTGLGDIKAGESVAVSVRRTDGGGLVGGFVRVQPLNMTIISQSGGVASGQFVSGTVAAVEANHIRVRTDTGEQIIAFSGTVRVSRFNPMPLSEIRQGERVAIDGEHLVDGSIAALAITALDAR
jgi:RNase P/RNase MRP subunit p29